MSDVPNCRTCTDRAFHLLTTQQLKRPAYLLGAAGGQHYRCSAHSRYPPNPQPFVAIPSLQCPSALQPGKLHHLLMGLVKYLLHGRLKYPNARQGKDQLDNRFKLVP
jgi:hypothetical protein